MLTSKLAFRELFGGYKKLIVFYICVLLSVFVIITVGQIAANLQNKLLHDSKIIFGGDLSITNANFPLKPEQVDTLKKYGKITYAAELRSMASYNDMFRIVELKGVDSSYPLLGDFVTQNNLKLPIKEGDAVISQELKIAFGLNIGDSINLSGINFRVADIIISEPDWIVTSFMIGPRVMVNVNSLQKAGLLAPGSLVQYNYSLLLNDGLNLENVESSISKALPYALVKNYKNGTSLIKNSISRLEFFLMLAAISNLLICGLGIAISAKRFLESKSTNIAILKSIGASKFQVIKIYSQILLALTVDASIFATIFSSIVCYFLIPYFNNFIDLNITFSFSWTPILKGFVFGIASTFCFAMPALLSCASINPALLFRSFSPLMISTNLKSFLIYTLFASILFVVTLLNTQDVAFAWRFILVSIIFVISFFFIAKLIQKIASQIKTSTPWLNLAKTNIHRPQAALPSIVVSISLALSVLIALHTVEFNFRRLLNESIPAKAPSLFFLDISKHQLQPLFKLFGKTDGISNIILKPSIQGLITHIKGIPIEKVKIEDNAKWAVSNHRRLSYSNTQPENNEITRGMWWDEGYIGKPLVSMDERIFNGMHLSIGDEITFNIMGEEIKATVANTRKIDYSTFNINFAIIFSPNVIESFPLSYFATVKAENKETEVQLLKEVANKFPTIVSIRTQDGINIASKQISNIIVALDIIVIISVISGFIVLIGAFLATEESRKYDTVVFKMLGSSKSYILRAYIFEWLISTIISCIIAMIAGSLGGYLILKYVSDFDFNIEAKSILYILGITITLVVATVALTNYRILRVKPMEVLKNE